MGVGTLNLDHEIVSEAVSSKAPEFDAFRISKSRELEENAPELADIIKELQKLPEGDRGDEKIHKLKEVFKEMEGKINPKIISAELGLLMPEGSQNHQEINYSGYGYIQGIYFDLEKDKPEKILPNINNNYIIEYLQQFLNDFRDIMVYDKSSQYVDETTATTENSNLMGSY